MMALMVMLYTSVQHKNENADGWSRHGGGEAEGQWISNSITLHPFYFHLGASETHLHRLVFYNIFWALMQMKPAILKHFSYSEQHFDKVCVLHSEST